MEGMSNPPTVNRRSIYWKCIIYIIINHQQTERCWIGLWDKWIILGVCQSVLQIKCCHMHTNATTAAHVQVMWMTSLWLSIQWKQAHPVDTDGPLYIEYCVSVLGACIILYIYIYIILYYIIIAVLHLKVMVSLSYVYVFFTLYIASLSLLLCFLVWARLNHTLISLCTVYNISCTIIIYTLL